MAHESAHNPEGSEPRNRGVTLGRRSRSHSLTKTLQYAMDNLRACKGGAVNVNQINRTLAALKDELAAAGDVAPPHTPSQEDLIALLDEVRQQFTRDDDLPNGLLPRIDAALDGVALPRKEQP